MAARTVTSPAASAAMVAGLVSARRAFALVAVTSRLSWYCAEVIAALVTPTAPTVPVRTLPKASAGVTAALARS